MSPRSAVGLARAEVKYLFGLSSIGLKSRTKGAERLFRSHVPMKKQLLAVVCCGCVLTSAAFAQSKTEPPVPVRTVPPDYPADLRRDGVSGIVTVKCQIDALGNVTEAEVEKSSNPAFDQPALNAIRKWKFKPARMDGTPTAIRVSIPIKFVFET